MQISDLCPRLARDGHCPLRALSLAGGSWHPFIPQVQTKHLLHAGWVPEGTKVWVGSTSEPDCANDALGVLVNASLKVIGRLGPCTHNTCVCVTDAGLGRPLDRVSVPCTCGPPLPVPLRCLRAIREMKRTCRLYCTIFFSLFCMLGSLHNKNVLGGEQRTLNPSVEHSGQ